MPQLDKVWDDYHARAYIKYGDSKRTDTKDIQYVWGYIAAINEPGRGKPLNSVGGEEYWYMGNDDARADFGLTPREQL